MNISQEFTMAFKVRLSYRKQYGKFKKPRANRKRRKFKARVQEARNKKMKPFSLPEITWQEYKTVMKSIPALTVEQKKALNKYRKRVNQPLIP